MDKLIQESMNFHGNHDWISSPMSSLLACILFIMDLWSWSLYFVEKEVVENSHKKYKAHKTSSIVKIHSMSGILETILGLLYVLHRNIFLSLEFETRTGGTFDINISQQGNHEFQQNINQKLAMVCGFIALLGHIPTGLMLAPKVWGIKNMTVTGYIFVGLLRFWHVYEVLFVDYRLLPQLWILLHTATMVRLVGYYVCPFSTTKRKGDLLTDPFIYTLSTGLATFTTLAFVYPPVVNVAALISIAVVEFANPTKIGLSYKDSKHILTNK